jgi:hypothetical protein
MSRQTQAARIYPWDVTAGYYTAEVTECMKWQLELWYMLAQGRVALGVRTRVPG